MNFKETLCTLFAIFSVFAFMAGLHNIDNAWNIKNFAENNEIMDCSGFLCLNASELYQAGISMVFIGIFGLVVSLVISLMDIRVVK